MFATLAGLLCAWPVFSQDNSATVRSPDGQITLSLDLSSEGHLTYSVARKEETLIAPSQLRLRLAEGDVSNVDVDARKLLPRNASTVHKLVATKAAEARRTLR